jgi:hypothetical protein
MLVILIIIEILCNLLTFRHNSVGLMMKTEWTHKYIGTVQSEQCMKILSRLIFKKMEGWKSDSTCFTGHSTHCSKLFNCKHRGFNPFRSYVVPRLTLWFSCSWCLSWSLTLFNPFFLPPAYCPALIYFGQERDWWVTCNYPTVLKEKNRNIKSTTCAICWLKSVLHEEKRLEQENHNVGLCPTLWFSSCSTDFSQQIVQVVLFLFFYFKTVG